MIYKAPTSIKNQGTCCFWSCWFFDNLVTQQAQKINTYLCMCKPVRS